MKALLLAMMEPTANIEQDFQDWYDHEHVPEREAVPGFINARRYVCLEGFPRYLALYDLDTVDVLKGDDYQKLLQPPPHHTRDKVLGRYRFTGNQIYPGDTLLGEGGAGTRLILLRFRKPPETEESHILRGLRRNFDDRSGVCQVRLFRGGAKSGTDYVATIECHANICEQRVKPEFFGTALKYMDIENVYAPYWRTTK
jgi:hypothetical protein